MKIVAASKSTNSRLSRFASAGVVCALLVVVSLLGNPVAAPGQTSQPPQGGQQPPQGQTGQAQGQTQGRQDQKQTASPDVAGAQLAPFFQAAGGREIQGEALPLERVLYGVYSPAERYRRLVAYWDLAGKNAYYNLCVTCSAYTTECATKIENQGAASQETQQILTSVRQIALQRQTEARLKLLQGQYDFDAAFTTPAGRRAATARAAQSGARSLDATRGAVFYLPSGKPATDVFETRFDAMAQYRNVSAEAARLNTLLPLLYETLQARANQANRELDVLVTLVKSAQVSESVLFAALDRYLDAQAQTIDAAVRYNQAIAAYATQTIPGSVQGAEFLATINQRPSAQTQQPSQQSGGAAPNQNGAPQNAPSGAPGSGGEPPQPGAPQGFSYYFPGYLPDGLRESIAAAAPPTPARAEAPTPEQTTAATPSDAAENPVASLASIQALAPTALPKSDAPAALATSLPAAPTFTLVGYSRPSTETAPAALDPAGAAPVQPANPEPAPEQPAPVQPTPEPAPTPEPTPAPEQPATPEPAPTPAPEQPATPEPTPAPAPEQPVSPQPEQPASGEPQQDAPKPGDVVASADPAPLPPEFFRSAESDQDFPIIVLITGYEQPLNQSEATPTVEPEQATASEKTEPASNPDGAFLWPRNESAIVSLFARLRAIFMTVKGDSTANAVLDSNEYVVRGQEFEGFAPGDFDAPAAPSNPGAPGVNNGAPNDSNVASVQPQTNASSADARRVYELVGALFAIEPPKARDLEPGVHERLYTLHEVASRSDQSPAGRYAVASAFWKLQGACARLRVEETIFQNFSLVYNNLVTQSGEDSDAARSCLAAALGQQARVTEAKSVKRAAQTELVKLMGRSPANAALPLPASIPFCGVKFDLGNPAYYNAQTRRSAGVIKERVAAVQTLGATLGTPGQLLNVDTNNVSATTADACVAALAKKRESALLFIDHVVRLNFSIAEYVAYFPARVGSDQFVDALVGR